MHVSGYDEAYDIPSEDAMRMSLATQLILAHESGVANTVDPLGGSMFLESLTSSIEEKAGEYIGKIEDLGNGSMLQGMLEAINSGYIEREISGTAYEYQRRIESKEYVIVGVNDYQSEVAQPLEVFQFDPREEEEQRQRLAQAKAARSRSQVSRALKSLGEAGRKGKNLMPLVLEAVGVGTTEGEIIGCLKEIYGEYTDPGVF